MEYLLQYVCTKLGSPGGGGEYSVQVSTLHCNRLLCVALYELPPACTMMAWPTNVCGCVVYREGLAGLME